MSEARLAYHQVLSAARLLLEQTSEVFSRADEWLCLWQRAMGMVFHTASFDESKVADTIQRLRQDVSWVAKVTRMTIPRNVASLDLVVLQPTTMKTITAGETTEPASECDGVSMPSADTGCWHHKVCYKPVDTDEDGVADLPADIRQAATEARRAEEAGKVDRAHSLYAEAVSRLMKLVGEQVSTEQANIE